MSDKCILVINCGSSSVKIALYNDTHVRLATGLAERLGTGSASLQLRVGAYHCSEEIADSDHQSVIERMLSLVDDQFPSLGAKLVGIGHRVVHGGEFFAHSVLINADVKAKIQQCAHLAPLHNPANLQGIEILQARFPDLCQVAVFDTAFHQTLKPEAYMYALPRDYYTRFGVRRYGFHGTSHRYVAAKAVSLLELDPHNHGVVAAHLGNGCSLAAIKNGSSVDTTMGFTPLEGLVMGTRCGDIDPSLHQYLAAKLGIDLAALSEIFNHQSGLLGLSGLSNDMRTLCAAAASGHTGAILAIEVFCYRLAKNIGAMAMALDRLDAVVFTGGIGENAALVRAKVVARLGLLGIALDSQRNDSHGLSSAGVISVDGTTRVVVIATEEEKVIAQDTRVCVTAHRL